MEILFPIVRRKSPTANPESNSAFQYCQREADAAIIAEEGAPSGPLLRAVNQIAEAVEHAGFDRVAVSISLPSGLHSSQDASDIVVDREKQKLAWAEKCKKREMVMDHLKEFIGRGGKRP